MKYLEYISNLRHAKNLSVTALHAIEKAQEGIPDKEAEENMKECLQDINKTILAINNELSRYNVLKLIKGE